MNISGDTELEDAFFNLLKEADPDIINNPSFAQEFANRLANFTEAWVIDPENIDAHEQSLDMWVESNVLGVASTSKTNAFFNEEEKAVEAAE